MMLSRHFLSGVLACCGIVWTVGPVRAGGDTALVESRPSSAFGFPVEAGRPPRIAETDREDWANVVDTLSQMLVDGNPRGVLSLVTLSASLQPFDRTSASGLQSLLACTSGTTLVSARAYDKPGATIAGDIATDLRGAKDLDSEIRRPLVPESDAQIRRANETAWQWIQSELDASVDDPIGVVVLYDRNRLPGQTAGFKFVLMKGERDSSQTFSVNRIIFGDPLDSKATPGGRAGGS